MEGGKRCRCGRASERGSPAATRNGVSVNSNVPLPNCPYALTSAGLRRQALQHALDVRQRLHQIGKLAVQAVHLDVGCHHVRVH